MVLPRLRHGAPRRPPEPSVLLSKCGSAEATPRGRTEGEQVPCLLKLEPSRKPLPTFTSEGRQREGEEGCTQPRSSGDQLSWKLHVTGLKSLIPCLNPAGESSHTSSPQKESSMAPQLTPPFIPRQGPKREHVRGFQSLSPNVCLGTLLNLKKVVPCST